MTLLTVVIPTIGRDTLERARDSVWRQTLPTNLVVEHDPGRTGTGPTISRGLEHVHTPWVATMGDDDALHPQYCELLEKVIVEHLQRQGRYLDMVIFQMQYADGSRLPLVTRPEDLCFGGVGCSYAVRTEMARHVGFIQVPCNPVLAEDWEMIQGVRAAGGEIAIVHRVVYYVRHDPFVTC